MSEQAPLFEVVTEPLSETEDVPLVPTGFISWEDLQRDWGIKPEQFNEDHDGAMSPVEPGALEDWEQQELGHEL